MCARLQDIATDDNSIDVTCQGRPDLNNTYKACSVHPAVMGGWEETMIVQYSLVHVIIKSSTCKSGANPNDQLGNNCKKSHETNFSLNQDYLNNLNLNLYLYLYLYLSPGVMLLELWSQSDLFMASDLSREQPRPKQMRLDAFQTNPDPGDILYNCAMDPAYRQNIPEAMIKGCLRANPKERFTMKEWNIELRNLL